MISTTCTGQSKNGQGQASDTNIASILKAAKLRSVPLSKIDFEDETHRRREKVTAVCKPDEIVVENGIADLSREHPVVLEQVGDRFRIVNGARRLIALRKRREAKRLRCRVVTRGTPHDVVIIASRINLAHGQAYSYAERRESFEHEREARQALGYPDMSDRQWARTYRVSPSTIGRWLNKEDSVPEEADSPAKSVPIEHPQDEKGGSESVEDESQVVCSQGVSEKNQVVHTAGVREAVESLEVAVIMVEEQPRDNLQDQICRLRDLYRRLGYLLKEYELGEEVAA